MKRFLFSFAYTLQAFRFAEFNALAELAGVEVVYDKEQARELDSEDDSVGVCTHYAAHLSIRNTQHASHKHCRYICCNSLRKRTLACYTQTTPTHTLHARHTPLRHTTLISHYYLIHHTLLTHYPTPSNTPPNTLPNTHPTNTPTHHPTPIQYTPQHTIQHPYNTLPNTPPNTPLHALMKALEIFIGCPNEVSGRCQALGQTCYLIKVFLLPSILHFLPFPSLPVFFSPSHLPPPPPA